MLVVLISLTAFSCKKEDKKVVPSVENEIPKINYICKICNKKIQSDDNTAWSVYDSAVHHNCLGNFINYYIKEYNKNK